MKFSDFKKLIELIEKTDKYVSDVYQYKIDLMDSPLYQGFSEVVKMCILQSYNYDGWEWFSWFVYEKMASKNELKAYDENDNEICQTVEDLWQFLEDNHKKNKK